MPPPTRTTWPCSVVYPQRLVRPSSDPLGCGSGTYVLTNVHWADWGGSKARGTGNYVLNTCSPTCAADNNVSYHATFVLDHVRTTSRGRVYGALRINYLHHGRHSTVKWDLPPFPAGTRPHKRYA